MRRAIPTPLNRLKIDAKPAVITLLVLLSTVAVAAALGARAQQAPSQEPSQPQYKGRTIAQVMSFHGAPWLERDSREEEEDPAALLAALPLEEGDTAADIGCGSGFYSRRLAQAVGPGGVVYGVDIQPEMLEILRRLAADEGLDNIRPVLSEAADPKLPAGEIDLILLVDVYHEFSDPEAMLKKMHEALAPDGVVALAEFRLEGESAAHIKLDHRMSVDQVKKEWLPAGFELAELIDDLPTQHLFLFRKSSQE